MSIASIPDNTTLWRFIIEDNISLWRLIDGFSVHSANIPTMAERLAMDRLVALGVASSTWAAGGGAMGQLYTRGPLFWDALDALDEVTA